MCLFGGGEVRSAKGPETHGQDFCPFMTSKQGGMLAPIPSLMPGQVYYSVKDESHTYAIYTDTQTHTP